MSVREMKTINVLNYNDGTIVVSTKNDGYSLPPASNGVPSTLPLSFDEIFYINSNSEIFKTGLLRFPEELEEEIYSELKISDWKNILTNEDIENYILNPTIDGLNKILAVKNIANFERIKGVFTVLKNQKTHDISMRVEDLIKARDLELRKGIRNTEIKIQAKDTEKVIPMDEVNSLKEQNQALQEQMLQMQEMMKHMMSMQNNSNGESTESEKAKEELKEEPKKKPGRPASKK